MPNPEFAERAGLGCFKKLILKCFGRGNDNIGDRKNQRYYFLICGILRETISWGFKNFLRK